MAAIGENATGVQGDASSLSDLDRLYATVEARGAMSEGDTPIPVLEMIRTMPAIKGYSIRLVLGDLARRKAAVDYVVRGLASGALKPVIDRTFDFDDMVEAHRYLENSGQFGKIVVTV